MEYLQLTSLNLSLIQALASSLTVSLGAPCSMIASSQAHVTLNYRCSILINVNLAFS